MQAPAEDPVQREGIERNVVRPRLGPKAGRREAGTPERHGHHRVLDDRDELPPLEVTDRDRVAGEQRVKAAAGSLRLQSPVSLSLDGVEGPGNYGLNKDCLMTIVAAQGM